MLGMVISFWSGGAEEVTLSAGEHDAGRQHDDLVALLLPSPSSCILETNGI